MANLFASSALALLGEDPEAARDPRVRHLLEALGYAPARESGGAEAGPEMRQRACLLKAASRFVRVFRLAAPDAPGLVCFGAEVDPGLADPMHAGSPTVSVSGVGITLQEAFQGCIGEGIEYLSQLQTDDDRLESSGFLDPAAEFNPSARDFLAAVSAYCSQLEGFSWLRATRLSDRHEVLLPADLCVRRPPGRREIKPPFPLGTGSAAGTSLAAAALHGMLELIERDAASLWWRGGRRGAAVPPDHEAQRMAEDLLLWLRQGHSARRNWLLDITTNIGIPCVASVSCTQDGFGFAFGLAARPTLMAAARSAILEMCQIELAHSVVEAKRRERGEAALNQQDWIHRRRATMFNVDRCPLLHPVPLPVEHMSFGVTDPNGVLMLIVERLEQFGIETFGLNLTRPRFAVPVARVIAPGLQLEPSGIITSRLADMITQTGGGAIYTDGVALI